MDGCLVYSGAGAGLRSVLSSVEALRGALQPRVAVGTLSSRALLAGGWQQGCRLLVMPGGADLPYCSDLNGPGNRLITDYVRAGGGYLGLCAGAYYATARVDFEPGTPCAPFQAAAEKAPPAAVGPGCARWWRRTHLLPTHLGGVPPRAPRLAVEGPRELAFFGGAGRGSIVPGFDYGTERGARAIAVSFRPGPGGGGAAPSPPGQGPPGEPPAAWESTQDYSNGGPWFVPGPALGPASQGEGPPWEVLARYPEEGDRIAAVACAVGQGTAVLCGTHPELAPHWLQGPAGAAAGAAPGRQEVTNLPAEVAELPVRGSQGEEDGRHVWRVREQLQRHAEGRGRLWRMLLCRAGLGDLLRGDQ